MAKKAFSLTFAAALLFAALCTGCSAKQERRIVIWTSSSEFAPYIELYNETHRQKAVLVYKENPAVSMPPENGEQEPDIVIGPWLRNARTKHFFKPADFLFDRKYISSKDFYPMLLEAGVFSRRQYLLPVSFNIPAMIFSQENKEFVEDNYTISLDQIKKAGTAYNKKDKNGSFTRIGFAPQSSDKFLYLTAKIRGADFREAKNATFTWNESSLAGTIDYLSKWISETNGSVRTENDFVYKYLSETDDKRVTSGRTLFAYMTSDQLFKLSESQISKIDFRWIQNDKKIPVEDSMIMMGISRNAANKAGAADFISWFFKTETQQALLERSASMHLGTTKFGIADGFSAIKEVNESILPGYYTALLSNIPQPGSFKVYEKKPARWEKIKQNIIIPYIKESLASDQTKRIPSINERYTEWKKQRFN